MPKHVLLGPQRVDPNLPQVLDQMGVEGPILAITAGWRHDEAELDALQAAIGPVVHLPLYRLFDAVRQAAPDVWATYRERQDRIARFKEIYRLRVHAALGTVRQLIGMHGSAPDLVGPQIERATEVVRSIDAEALAAVDEVRAAYSQLGKRFEHDWIRRRRDAAAAAIAGAGVVLIAGGHVAVLRNRLFFFGVDQALKSYGGPVLSWGAGNMVLTERIVLFYDDAPFGPAEAEVLDHGLALIPNVVLFPHAHERLRLEDPERVGALARRFGPDVCLGLEKGAWVEQLDGRWVSRGLPDAAFVLSADGSTSPLGAS